MDKTLVSLIALLIVGVGIIVVPAIVAVSYSEIKAAECRKELSLAGKSLEEIAEICR